MHAHRVHVFDRTDDDGVIRFVADHFHFVFFPAQERFIDEDLTHWRCIHARAAVVFIFFAVIGNATARAAQGERGADNCRQTDVFECFHRDFHASVDVVLALCIFRGSHDRCARIFEANTVHRFAEQFAVFGHLDRFAVRADELDVEFLKHTHVRQSERGVQASLTTHRREKRVGAFFLDDLRDDLRGDRFDVGGIGQTRVGHDRRGVRVHEDDAVAFFAKCFTRLSARVVKLASLANHNWPRSDDHDRLDVGSLRHGTLICYGSRQQSA